MLSFCNFEVELVRKVLNQLCFAERLLEPLLQIAALRLNMRPLEHVYNWERTVSVEHRLSCFSRRCKRLPNVLQISPEAQVLNTDLVYRLRFLIAVLIE